MRNFLRFAVLSAGLALLAGPARADSPLSHPIHNPAYVQNILTHHHHAKHATRADRIARYYASHRPWHGNYAYTQWGSPVALVVPPTANMHTSLAWGVAQSEMVPIYHQYFRDYPGGYATGNGPFMPTPYWPSHTDQFGVYPVRGPW